MGHSPFLGVEGVRGLGTSWGAPMWGIASSNQTSLDTSQCNRQAAPGWALGAAPSKGFGMSCLSYNKGINLSLLGHTQALTLQTWPQVQG